MRWPRSKWIQSGIAFVIGIVCALGVLGAIAMDCVNLFYFLKNFNGHGIGFGSGPHSTYELACCGGLTLIGIFLLLLFLQRVWTRTLRV
jgi:hypothetical protein